MWANSNLASWCAHSSDVIEKKRTWRIRKIQNFRRNLGLNDFYGLKDERQHSTLQWQQRRFQEWISEGLVKFEQSWCSKRGPWGTWGVVRGVIQVNRASQGWRKRYSPRLAMNYVTVEETIVVLWLNRSSGIPTSTLLPLNIFLLLLSRPQQRTLPQPRPSRGGPPLLSPHLPSPPIALHLLAQHVWPSSAACFLLWLLPPLTTCEMWGEARTSSSSAKACDYIQNGYLTLARAGLHNVRCNLFREGSHNISGRTRVRAQASGSHLSMVPQNPSWGSPARFQRPVPHVNSCLALWKTPENRTVTTGFGAVVFTAFWSGS